MAVFFLLRAFLEGLYYVYARRELIYPDPLYYVYQYDNQADREVVGLVAAGLAYGRVKQIMKSVDKILSCLGSHPRDYILKHGDSDIVPSSFKHRFTTSYDMNNLFRNTKRILVEYDSIDNCLRECMKSSNGELLPALEKFSAMFSIQSLPNSFPLIPSPTLKSPCKRLMLYIKWFSRHDLVDPGGFSYINPSQLIIPLDTHMLSISHSLNLTHSLSHSLNNALIISHNFSLINPFDPTKYDFVLTRFGIREGLIFHFG